MKALNLVLAGMLLLGAGQGLAYESSDNEETLSHITKILRMTRVLKRSGGVTTAHMASIFERTAEKVEDLDTTGVEDDVQDWGFEVARRLRNVSLMFRDIGMRARVSGDQYRTDAGYRYWGYYHAFWWRTSASNPARRVATYDAGRFKWEQYSVIRSSGVQLRRKYR